MLGMLKLQGYDCVAKGKMYEGFSIRRSIKNIMWRTSLKNLRYIFLFSYTRKILFIIYTSPKKLLK